MNINQSRSSRSQANIWSKRDNYGEHSSSTRRNRTPSPTFTKRRAHPSITQQDENESDQWICIKCSIKNYNRRETCFKCGITRNESEMLDAKGYTMVGVIPSDTLLIRELPSSAMADSIGQALMRFSGVPVQRVQISASRHYAFVQLESKENAASMLRSFQKVVPYVDNCAVIVNYSRQSFNELFAKQGMMRGPAISDQDDPPSLANQQQSSGTVMTPFGQLQVHESPDSNSFKLEPSSGYFYDSKTGYYYDPKSDYYFNPKTNQWMFWCSKFSTYINCEGGDLEMKKHLQEEERDYQFRQKHSQQERTDVERHNRRIRIDVPPLDEKSDSSNKMNGDRIGQGERIKVPSENESNTVQANLLAMLEQTEEFMATLRADLVMAMDQHSIAKIHKQVEALQKQRETLQASLVSLQQSTSSTTPQFKRHITKNIVNQPTNVIGRERPPSVVELIDDDPEGWRDVHKNISNDSNSWRRTAFDDHIEQAKQSRLARKEEEKRANRMMTTDEIERGTEIEAQIRQMVDQRFQHHESSNRGKNRRSSSSIERDERGHRSHRHRSSRSSSRRNRTRSRSRRRDRDREYERRRGDRRRSNSPISRGQEPMTISPQPQPIVPMNKLTNESWIGSPDQMRAQIGMGLGSQHGLHFLPMGAPPNAMFGSPAGAQSHHPLQILPPSQFIGIGQSMIAPTIGGTIPVGIPTPGMPPMLQTQQKQFFPSNDDHWRLAARLQQEHLIPTAISSSRYPGTTNEILPGALSKSAMQVPSSSGPSTQLCTNCLCFGHSRINCSMDKNKNKQSRDLEFLDGSSLNLKKMEVVEKERNKLINLNICFNCGRPGHNQFGCRHERISDDELQRKIRRAEENSRRKEIDKERLKRKAEKYPVRRKDIFIERLREVAPRGKITKELIRSVCSRCSSLNHSANECRKREIARSIHKKVCQALEEFTKVFFVHLNDNNLVDFSQKFDTFSVMDAIERGGTIDPVGLQLQSRCKDGIVTQGDLRELCSKCANLGHKQQDCEDKDGCSRTHYEKMLTLVKGYRALVKEGKGNFLLPNAKLKLYFSSTSVLKQIQSAPTVSIEEIVLLESSEDEEADKYGENEVEQRNNDSNKDGNE